MSRNCSKGYALKHLSFPSYVLFITKSYALSSQAIIIKLIQKKKKKGFNINEYLEYIDDSGYKSDMTALTMAIILNDTIIILSLLENGADINLPCFYRDYTYTPLCLAYKYFVMNESHEIIQKLFKHNPILQTDNGLCKSLTMSCLETENTHDKKISGHYLIKLFKRGLRISHDYNFINVDGIDKLIIIWLYNFTTYLTYLPKDIHNMVLEYLCLS
jgi:hypothetical protein